MASALGDEHVPTTEVDLGPLDSASVSASVPGQFDFTSSPAPEIPLTVHYVALVTVIIANYCSFSALLRTPSLIP